MGGKNPHKLERSKRKKEDSDKQFLIAQVSKTSVLLKQLENFMKTLPYTAVSSVSHISSSIISKNEDRYQILRSKFKCARTNLPLAVHL
jgi:hypothetical protein